MKFTLAIASKPHLPYAPAPAWHRRRRIRRIFLLLLTVGLALAAAKWVWPARRQIAMLYAQWQCLRYTAPPDQVVYEEDPQAAHKLATLPGYVFNPVPSPSMGVPGPPYTSFAPKCWENFAAASGLGGGPRVVFLHELRSKTGIRRLVQVERGIPSLPFPQPLGLWCTLIEPAGLRSSPRQAGFDVVIYSGPGTAALPTSPLRLYAGQPDPADAAHFTINYAINNIPGILDGRMNDDGTRIEIIVRTGPALEPEWTRLVAQP